MFEPSEGAGERDEAPRHGSGPTPTDARAAGDPVADDAGGPVDSPPGGEADGDAEGEALAAAVRARRDGAMEAFLERYKPLLSHCIAQFASEAGAREDLYQELLGYVVERLDAGSFDPEKGSFGTWLYRVAWCRCVDVKRRESSGRRLATVPTSEITREPMDEHDGPEDAVGGSEVGALVRACLGDLDREEAELLRMRHIQEMTLVDIAEARGQTLETVKYRVKRATQSLRQRLLARHVAPEMAE